MQSLLSITARLWTAVRRLAPVGRGKLPGFQPVAGRDGFKNITTMASGIARPVAILDRRLEAGPVSAITCLAPRFAGRFRGPARRRLRGCLRVHLERDSPDVPRSAA